MLEKYNMSIDGNLLSSLYLITLLPRPQMYSLNRFWTAITFAGVYAWAVTTWKKSWARSWSRCRFRWPLVGTNCIWTWPSSQSPVLRRPTWRRSASKCTLTAGWGEYILVTSCTTMISCRSRTWCIGPWTCGRNRTTYREKRRPKLTKTRQPTSFRGDY